MKLSITQAINIKNIFGKMAEEKLPIKLSYKIMKLVTSIEKEEEFFNKKFNSLIENYGERNEKEEFVYIDEVNIKIKEDKKEECRKEMEELQTLEIEIPDYYFTLEELESLSFSPRELFSLDAIIQS